MSFEDGLFGFGMGIAESLVAAVIYEYLRSKSGWTPSPMGSPQHESAPEDTYDERRARNRQRAAEFFKNVIFYAITFYLTYLAAFGPVIFKAMRTGGAVYLDGARFIGDFLPNVPVTSSLLQAALIPWCMLMYVLVMLVMGLFARVFKPLVSIFYVVTHIVWIRVQLAISLVITGLLAIASIYVYYDVTLQNAATALFVILALGFFLAKG